MASARSELFVTPRSKSGKASAWRRNTNWATPRPRQYQPGPKYGSARRASRNSSSPSSAQPIWERTMPKSARFPLVGGVHLDAARRVVQGKIEQSLLQAELPQDRVAGAFVFGQLD